MNIGLKNHLCFRLYVASRLIVQGYGEGLKSLGITYPKYLVLLALAEQEGQTVNQLGDLLSLDSGTLSPILKSLLKSGYIRRERLSTDERTVLNYLTPQGKSLCDKARKIAYQLFQETGFSEEEHRELCSVMDDYVSRCQKILNRRSQNESPKPNKIKNPSTRNRSATGRSKRKPS